MSISSILNKRIITTKHNNSGSNKNFSLDVLNLGKILTVDEKPEKSDVIVVLGGENIIRTDYGVKLFKDEYSNRLLFTGGNINFGDNGKEAEVMRNEAIKLCVPNEDIILEDKATSTYENAIFSKEIIMSKGFESAIIVTSDYHMLRSKLVFNKAFKGTGIKLTFCSSQSKKFKPQCWFTDKYSRHVTISEYKKLLRYFVKGRL
jgi:uncharacterized SAM-binding protein YcdF (DUF218 family)